MTDLHCHILPNIDDGAKDVSISLRLLEKEYADGVRNIAFTSHFNSEWTTPDAFLQKRAAAYETLTAALPTGPEAMQFRFKLGCEVYFSPSSVSWMPRRSASAIPLICWWSFPLPTSPISSGRPSPSCRSRAFCPSSPTSSDTPTSSKTPPCSTTGWPPNLCPNQRGRTAGFSKTAPDALQVHLVAACPRHLDGHPLPGQTPAPDGRSRCCSGKELGRETASKLCRTATHFSTMRSWMFSLPAGPKVPEFLDVTGL